MANENTASKPVENKKKSTGGFSKFAKKYSMVIALVAVFIIFYIITDGKLMYAQNLSNLLLQNGYVLVMACGMLLCILTGGNIDLSVGSVICLVGGVAAVMVTNLGWNPFVTILVGIALGIIAGIIQGLLIGYVRIPPFITTLGGMFVFRGLGRLVLDSKTVSMQDQRFLDFFTVYIRVPGLDVETADQTRLLSPIIVAIIIIAIIYVSTFMGRKNKQKKGYRQDAAWVDYLKATIVSAVIAFYFYKLSLYKGISVMLVWVAGICLLYYFITSKTAFGRYFYAVGGSEKATKLSGINTNKVYFLAYANMGLLAGLCGLLCLARVGSVSGATGTSFEMDAIGSCFIGGASAYGGSGSVPGVIIGALLLGVINMGMSIKGIGDSWQYVVKGLVLLLAVVFDVLSHKNGGASFFGYIKGLFSKKESK